MNVITSQHQVILAVDEDETAAWAARPGRAWPASGLAGHRIWAEFDATGLIDLQIDGLAADPATGRFGDLAVDAHELAALCADLIAPDLSPLHPAYPVAVGPHHAA